MQHANSFTLPFAKPRKGGRALYAAPYLVLVAADTGTMPQTPGGILDAFTQHSRHQFPSPEEETLVSEKLSQHDWLDTPCPNSDRHPRHTDVSHDLRYTFGNLSAAEGDEECTTAPRRIPEWILSHEEVQELYAAGHGTAPDLIYARGVPDSPHPDPTTFNKRHCILIIVEIGFCRDLGCDTKLEAKTAKYAPLLAALRRH